VERFAALIPAVQVRSRSLQPGEANHELIWLTVSLGSLAFAAAWFAFGLPWPRCTFHSLTGHPCLTCGMTRSAMRFFHGDFVGALRWNPLVFVALCGLSIFDAYAFAVLIFRAPRLRVVQFTAEEKKVLRVVAVALMLANWIYLLSRPPGWF
jgi:uncharacterized protein DUF2752